MVSPVSTSIPGGVKFSLLERSERVCDPFMNAFDFIQIPESGCLCWTKTFKIMTWQRTRDPSWTFFVNWTSLTSRSSYYYPLVSWERGFRESGLRTLEISAVKYLSAVWTRGTMCWREERWCRVDAMKKEKSPRDWVRRTCGAQWWIHVLLYV